MSRPGALCLLAIAVLLFAGCATQPKEEIAEQPVMRGKEQNFATVRVHFATDREPAASLEEPWFLGKRGDGSLSYGTVDVSIPRDHRMGELEGPSIWRLEFVPDPEKHVMVQAVQGQAADDFWRDLTERATTSPTRKAFVFIHGYNVDFPDAARRTAQLSYDLGFEGAPVFYSWPSRAELLGYGEDEETVEWSMPHLRGFFADLAQRLEGSDIYVIAHSMGNRPTSRALAGVFSEMPELRPRFKEVILMAPDIDAGVFKRDIAPALITGESRVTLYASRRDKALKVSAMLHGGQRLGDADPDIVMIPGMDSIDASDVETDLLGHSYYGDARTVLADLFEVVRDKGAAQVRSALEEITASLGRFWRFRVPRVLLPVSAENQ